MSEQAMEEIHCPSCGIFFSIEKKVANLWRESHKSFFCPNQHSMSWQAETADQKELKSLRVEVKELRAKVESYKANEAALLKKVEELTNEIEIWKPTSK